jgi:glutamate---cysteine ligase / carboxylate-amine ligase
MSVGRGLFSQFGIEIEYAVVGHESLDVRPVVDILFEGKTGVFADVASAPIAWSHELVNHVLEMKVSEPVRDLVGVDAAFQRSVQEANLALGALDCRLLPTGMHPWMNPETETMLWRHEDSEIYQAYDRLFNCRRHGWANLQSVHLNLPFSTEEEFRRLHSAIRLLLPLLPALSASSPFVNGGKADGLNMRMMVYAANSSSIPSVTGLVVPELILDQKQYEREILGQIYDDIRSLDSEGLLADDWMNARGAIARFDRKTIEIRVLDTQECPRMDLGILAFVVEVLKRFVNESISSLALQELPTTPALAGIFQQVLVSGLDTVISDEVMLRAVGCTPNTPRSVRQIWSDFLSAIPTQGRHHWNDIPELILSEGNLAERILRSAGPNPDRATLRTLYRDLANCLEEGRQFC